MTHRTTVTNLAKRVGPGWSVVAGTAETRLLRGPLRALEPGEEFAAVGGPDGSPWDVQVPRDASVVETRGGSVYAVHAGQGVIVTLAAPDG